MNYETFLAKVEATVHLKVPKVSHPAPPMRAPVVSSSPTARSPRVEACHDVLDGDVGRLISAFSWADTPQGNAYWFARCYGEESMSDYDTAYVRHYIMDNI